MFSCYVITAVLRILPAISHLYRDDDSKKHGKGVDYAVVLLESCTAGEETEDTQDCAKDTEEDRDIGIIFIEVSFVTAIDA